MLQRMVEPSPIRAAELVSAHITISDEVGGYAAALSRAHLDVVRTGEGCGPNTLATESFDDAQMFAGLIQFPVIGRTIINDGIIAAALIVRAQSRVIHQTAGESDERSPAPPSAPFIN